LHGCEPAGSIQLDWIDADELVWELSIYVAPQHLRLGLAKAAVSLSQEFVAQGDFIAHVMPGNDDLTCSVQIGWL